MSVDFSKWYFYLIGNPLKKKSQWKEALDTFGVTQRLVCMCGNSEWDSPVLHNELSSGAWVTRFLMFITICSDSIKIHNDIGDEITVWNILSKFESKITQ